MVEENFFSKNHTRLLNISSISKFLAWIVLVAYIFLAIIQIFQYQNLVTDLGRGQMSLWSYFKSEPLEFLELIANMTTIALRGMVFFLILKGLSLGLNMIVETDINYREQKGGSGEQRTA